MTVDAIQPLLMITLSDLSHVNMIAVFPWDTEQK